MQSQVCTVHASFLRLENTHKAGATSILSDEGFAVCKSIAVVLGNFCALSEMGSNTDFFLVPVGNWRPTGLTPCTLPTSRLPRNVFGRADNTSCQLAHKGYETFPVGCQGGFSPCASTSCGTIGFWSRCFPSRPRAAIQKHFHRVRWLPTEYLDREVKVKIKDLRRKEPAPDEDCQLECLCHIWNMSNT